MLTPKNPQKSLPATIAHVNDLLDEALKETFPVSDPTTINIDLESPEHGITITPGFRAALRGTRKAPQRRQGVTVATAGLEIGSDA